MNVLITGGDLPGLKALMARMKDANRNVLVGLPASAKAEADGTSVVTVGVTHEFGSPEQNIPERSWLRGGIARARDKISSVSTAGLKAVVNGTGTVERALNLVGNVAVGEVKRGFTEIEFAPLKPATIARKHSSRPLIDSGNLRQEVTYQLEPAGERSRVI